MPVGQEVYLTSENLYNLRNLRIILIRRFHRLRRFGRKGGWAKSAARGLSIPSHKRAAGDWMPPGNWRIGPFGLKVHFYVEQLP